MVEKVTKSETKIAANKLGNVRNSIFGHIQPLVGRNYNNNHCSSPKSSTATTNRSSRYAFN